MASFSVVNNIASANAQANLATTNIGLQQALNRLSSGLRINRSGDDAAGLAVANAYRSTIAVLNQGMRNAGDGLSTLQIKDGALNNISNLLDRLATLATQSASSSATVSRASLDLEFQDVLTEIDREATVAGLDASGGFLDLREQRLHQRDRRRHRRRSQCGRPRTDGQSCGQRRRTHRRP